MRTHYLSAISCVVVLLAPGPARSETPARIARCESLLVTQAQASRQAERPFALDIGGSDGARLTYIGVRHTIDPADSQFVALRQAWVELAPTIAFYEGSGRSVGSSADSSVVIDGEPGLVRYLAWRAGIPARSLEPPRTAEVDELLGSFTAEQILLFYVTRSAVEERDEYHPSAAALDTFFTRALARFQRIPQLAKTLADTAEYRRAFVRWFPGRDPAGTPADWFDPRRTSAETGSKFMNDVNRVSSAFRDHYMYRLIAGAWGPGVRIFAAVGRDHVPAQAAALRCALGQ
jgi:hypothetical protein